jgi:hypothetical protein
MGKKQDPISKITRPKRAMAKVEECKKKKKECHQEASLK